MGKENLKSSFLSKEIKFFQKNLKQIGIIFSLVILISLLFPGGEALKYSYKINDVTREPIIAPYTFPILKTEKDYDEDKKAEKKSVAYIFNRNQETPDIQLKTIDEFFETDLCCIVSSLRYTFLNINSLNSFIMSKIS